MPFYGFNVRFMLDEVSVCVIFLFVCVHVCMCACIHVCMYVCFMTIRRGLGLIRSVCVCV
jgi:hypothetical protein